MRWRFHPASAFADHAERWRGLNAACGDSPLLDPLFIAPALAEFATGDELIGALENGGAPVAMGIFAPRGRWGWQTFQTANAPLGAWLSDPARPVAELLESLLRALPGFPVLAAISQADPDLVSPPGPSATIATADYIETSRVSHDGPFDAYWSSRSKNLRHNIKRQYNRLGRENVETRLEAVSAPEAMGEAVAGYAELETAGWKAEAGSAVQAEDHQGRFYTTMLEGFARRGEAIVYRYFFDNRLAASDICLLRNRCLIILKTAYDESRKGYSPAQLMRYEVMRELFDDGRADTIEFYGPVKDWHRKLTDEIRTMYHVNCYRWPLIRTLHQARAARGNGAGG